MKNKTMTLSEITNYLQDICHYGKADKEVVFEDCYFVKKPVENIRVFEQDDGKLVLKINGTIEKEFI